MAFVFQSQRWKPQHIIDEPGPAHYNYKEKSQPKGGFILPEHQFPVNRLSQDQQKFLRQGLLQKQQRYHHQASQKILKRAQSAKLLGALRSSVNQSSQAQVNQNNRQSTNTNVLEYNFSNGPKLHKTLYKRPKSYINYKSHTQIANRQLFNDKNLRKKNNTHIPDQNKEDQQDNHEFFNSILNNQQPNNTNLNKFAQSRKVINPQNSFIAKQPSFMKKQNQNFIIANENCIKNNLQTNKNLQNTKNDKILDGKIDSFDDIQTTTIDDSFSDEDSIEYILDATPGPGEYELRKDKPITKSRVEKFGVTEKRFKDPKRQQTVLKLNANMPTFKKTSKASQDRVSFGKSRPQTAKQTYSEFLLYEDRQTIENRCIRNLIKDRTDPGTFLSKSNRFEKIKKQPYFGPDFFQKDKEKGITLPDSTYMSRVDRHQNPMSPTVQVDFKGQDYKTIEKSIQNLNERKQVFDNQTPGFSVTQPRFKYKQKQEQNGFIPKFSRSSSGNKKQLKSYTFRRQQTKQKSPQIDSPAPWAYTTQMIWVKPSHHVRFKF